MTFALRGLAIPALALFAVAFAAAGETAAPLVIVGGTVIDGTGRPPLADGVIVIRAGKFVSVTSAETGSLPPDARRIDAGGKWIIPGLIDMHVHYHEWMDEPFLRHGVTTVRDVGANLESILALRRESRAGDARKPRIFACGPLIDGPLPRHGSGISESVATEEEARDVARRLLARGVDCLKVYEQITPPLVRAVVEEAHRAGVPVTAHLRDTSAVAALEAGVRGLEHAFGFPACDEGAGEAVARLLVSRNAYVVPTLAITSPSGSRLPCLKRFIGRLAKAGGRVLAGSDTANSRPAAGALLHRELELLVEAGREVIVAAVTLGTAVALTVWGAGHARMFCGLIGTVMGTMAAATLGIISGADLASIASAPLVSIPRIGHLRWSFDFALMAPFAVIAAAGCLVVMGNVTTCQKINDREWTRPDMRSITGGVVADGLGSICAGLLGTVPMNSASSNVGLTTATGVTSRVLAYVMGGMFLVLALTPKASAVLAALPRPVIGATLVFTACFILVNGIGIITSRLSDARKTIVIGMGLLLGVTAEVYATFFANLDTLWRPLVSSAVVFATLSAVVLNLVFRLGARRRQALVVESKAFDPSVLHDFMETWGSRWGARRDVIDRATFSLAQSIETIIEGCAPGRLQIEASFDEFNLDLRVSYDGALLELPERRPTNDEIMASEHGQRKLAGFMLRRYADRVQGAQRDGRSTILFHFDH